MGERKRRLVIAVDGPVGAGKSTAARRLAQALGYVYIDSGAMYRALGWKAVQCDVDLRDEARLADLAAGTDIQVVAGPEGHRITVDGLDVTGRLRTPAMDEASSLVSTCPAVRTRMVALQRAMAQDGGVVMDGRDIGTVVFPGADVKFYLDADLDVRVARHLEDLRRTDPAANLEVVRAEVARRDLRDQGRETSPLRVAEDAIRIDTTSLDAEEVLRAMLTVVQTFLKSDNS